MKKKKGLKITAIVLAVAIIGTVAGVAIYNKADDIDFGEIKVADIPEKAEGTVRVMSYNVRCMSDPEGSINNRSKLVTAVLEGYAPDSFGVQEANSKWMNILEKNLGDKYAYVGEPRDFLGPFSEYSAVFYLKDKFNLLDSGTFWLSETPDKKNTKSFESECYRIATWALLENKETGEKYTHVNTHLDHVLESTRLEQAKVLISKIEEFQKNGKVICTGDFNTDNTESAYSELVSAFDNTMLTAENTDSGTTYHDYGKEPEDKLPIDFIFATKGTSVATYKVADHTFKPIDSGKLPEGQDVMYPSDHHAICADIYV